MANCVKFSLKNHYSWWAKNSDSQYIQDIILNGYKLPLLEVPKTVFLKNNKSAKINSDFVTQQVDKLVKDGIVIELKSQPTVVNALTVAVNTTGKKRLVLDMRSVNPILNVPSFKFEDIRVASAYFSNNCFMCMFDLSSGYHHVDINTAYQQYLGFCWEDKFYNYSVCPFGMASAGLVFTKVLRQLVKKWRSQGIAVVLYLDDGLIVSRSKLDMELWVEIIQTDLAEAGFKVNESKSCWIPAQQVKWLGIILNSVKNEFEVPAEKLGRLKIAIFRNLKYRSTCSPRELAKTIGKITSLYHVYGGIVYIMTKETTRWIAQGSSWNLREQLPDVVVNELSFWFNNLAVIIKKPLVQDLTRKTYVVYSDASATGCGAFVQSMEGLDMVHYWHEYEKKASSTWRELKAVQIYLKTHAKFFSGLAITWYTDNQAVPVVVYKGSMKVDLNALALEVYKICITNDIDLSIYWVPREENEIADELSKVEDIEDWQVHPSVFHLLQARCGPFTLDAFASNLSNKTKKFYSKYWCKDTSGVNAFSYDWGKENLWLVPPPRLISQVLFHARKCKAVGILVVPKWQSAAFWPLIWDGKNWLAGITLLLEYVKPTNFFQRGPFGNNVFSEQMFNSNVLVLKVDFSAQ